MTRKALIAISLLALTWAAAASAAHTSARTAAEPQAWMATTCNALSTLQHGVANRWGAVEAQPQATRSSLLRLLAADAADGAALLEATRVAPAGLPHGAAIAATLRGRATALSRYIAARRTAVSHAPDRSVAAAALATASGLHVRAALAGNAFIHLERSFSSPALISAIDQAPACALVHG